MLTDLWRLLRNLSGRYPPKTLTQALGEYDKAVGDSDPRDLPFAIFLDTDMTPQEFEAIQEVADDDQRSAQSALDHYTTRNAGSIVVNPGQYQQVRSVLYRWAGEEANATRQAA